MRPSENILIGIGLCILGLCICAAVTTGWWVAGLIPCGIGGALLGEGVARSGR